MYTPVRLGSVIFIIVMVAVKEIWDYIDREWHAIGLIKVLCTVVVKYNDRTAYWFLGRFTLATITMAAQNCKLYSHFLNTFWYSVHTVYVSFPTDWASL
jgi:hypothetical protein